MIRSTLTADIKSLSGRTIRPLHGMNSGPMTKVFTYDARDLFKEAGFPFARLHDVEYPYGSGEFVDMHNIFPVFDADETKEENYNFALTDLYLGYCMEVGAIPLYRLGESIEHAPVKRHIFPPKDYEKWARIAEHIIMHYTEGWANGFHWPIEYWEIWNESDGGSKNNWQGTPEEFYEFYCISATYLKKRFPHFKIGGCAFTTAENDFIIGFFEYISSRPYRVPLDFYSWHRYFVPMEKLLRSSCQADTLLKKYGYPEAESILDEWNYMESWDDQAESYRVMKDHRGAAFNAAVLSAMQSLTNIQAACQFEADVVKEFCDVFNVKNMSIGRHKAELEPTKSFYAFKSFNELYKLKNELNLNCSDPEIYFTGAASEDGRSFGLLIANPSDEEREVGLDLSNVPSGTKVRLTDRDHFFEVVKEEAPAVLSLPPTSFVFIGNTLG